MNSKLGGTTPTRQFERTRPDAGEAGLEGVDGIGVDHRLMSLRTGALNRVGFSIRLR